MTRMDWVNDGGEDEPVEPSDSRFIAAALAWRRRFAAVVAPVYEVVR